MSRSYTRTVSTNAEPSRATWSMMPRQPRTCSSCGITIRITKDAAWFRHFPKPRTLCERCFCYLEAHG